MRFESRILAVGFLSILLVHCAKGTVLTDTGAGAGSSEGGDGGDGANGHGAGPTGSAGNTGTTDPSGVGGAGGGSTTSTSSSSSSSSTTSSSSSSTTTSSSSSTTTSSSTSSSTSGSGGGGSGCNPMNPGLVCAGTEHCFPQPNGQPICQGPVGPDGPYAGCQDPSECQAALICICRAASRGARATRTAGRERRACSSRPRCTWGPWNTECVTTAWAAVSEGAWTA
jgi:hypothetical protein